MFDRPIIALKDEEEMEDFHDYDDEEHSELDSKLDDYEDDEDEDDDEDGRDRAASSAVVDPVLIAVVEPCCRLRNLRRRLRPRSR